MNLPSLQHNQVMSSREIAALVETTHDSVLKTIRSLNGRGVVAGNETTYINPQNKQEYPEFMLSFRDTMIVASGYNVELRAKVIDRWQELESQQIPKTLPEALRLAADLAERNAALENKIEVDAPKVEFAMSVRRMEGSCKIGDFCKVIGMGRNTMFSRMRADEILMADNMQYQRYIDLEYFVVVEGTPYTDRDGKAHPTFTTHITGKGQIWLERKYRKVV